MLTKTGVSVTYVSFGNKASFKALHSSIGILFHLVYTHLLPMAFLPEGRSISFQVLFDRDSNSFLHSIKPFVTILRSHCFFVGLGLYMFFQRNKAPQGTSSPGVTGFTTPRYPSV
ncbi:hypothetical protein AVEN_266506-1 [Araneus ventricosus]|uniref:Uncharacterized protein n=1 Tax=Araneus ventricosus TaxID=182803 RepID=A0A4Y2I3G7_ARAVE|nr:hypothetical protein AVEN_266506-1 [Araneus ventricosus]